MSNFLKKHINPYKKRFFKALTSTFKNSNNISELSAEKREDIKRILVTRPNHRLGNQILLSPLIQSLEAEFPKAKIHILVNGNLSKILFENYPNVEKIYALPKKPFKNLGKYLKVSIKLLSTTYDLTILGDESSNSSKIFAKLSNSTYKIFGSLTDAQIPMHIAKRPVYNLYSVLLPSVNSYDYPRLDLRLSENEIARGKEIISDYFGQDKKVVAIFTNATGGKKISKQWWFSFCELLEKSKPDLKILEILPKENISQVDFKYESYLSNDLREIASVIENCVAFIGADSGVMHLATATNTYTFGLFNGTTNPEVYGPYGNKNYTLQIENYTLHKLVQDIDQKIKIS